MDPFILFLLLGVLLFIGSFMFAEKNIIFMFFSGLIFMLLRTGLMTGTLHIVTDTQQTIEYTGGKPTSIIPQETYLDGNFLLFFELFFVFFGVYLVSIAVIQYRHPK